MESGPYLLVEMPLFKCLTLESVITLSASKISFVKAIPTHIWFPKRTRIVHDVKKRQRKTQLAREVKTGRGRDGGTISRDGRVSRELTLLALGIIRPAKEIGIARNGQEGVEFHMKYT